MTDPIRAALERLIARLDETADPDGPVPAWVDSYCAARAALAEQQALSESQRYLLARYGHQPTPPAEGEVAELVERLRDWHTIPTLEERARAAELLQQQHPTPVPVSERLPGPEEMDGSLVWCGSQAAGLPYWEWCLDDIRHPGSSGYTHWLPANTPALPTALPLPQGEVE